MIERISMYDYAKGIDIEAYTDGYSYDEYGYLHLVSILGHDSAVKAISSGIVSQKDVTIQQGNNWAGYAAMYGEKYRIFGARLDSRLLHQIVAIDALFNPANNSIGLIYIGASKEITTVIFNTIKKNLSTPLLPEWKDWLIHQIQKEELMKVMQGNVQIVRFSLTEKELDSIISEGIKQRSIRF
jgi:hypothetical protein